MSVLPKVVLKPHKEIFVKAGHPWIFSNAILKSEAREIGLCEVLSNENRSLGLGMFNPNTTIRVRMIDRDSETKIDQQFFENRFRKLYEQKVPFLPKDTNAYRLVNAESDFLPGLIVDIFDKYAVFQIHTATMDLYRENIIASLKEIFDNKLKAIVERSDLSVRKMEGVMPLPVTVQFGKVTEPVLFKESRIKFMADILNGQKTGFFLDQRDARRKLGELSKGKKVLNLFSYTGGFGLYAAINGAKLVCNVDASKSALQLAEENFKINGKKSDEKYQFIEADIFHYLNQIKKGEFDVIICDPPAFAKSNEKLEQAKKAYSDINRKCFELLDVGGILLTSSCSGRVTSEDFRDVIRIAAGKSGRDARVLCTLGAASDHTERICFPEGKYLKTLVLEVLRINA